MSEEVAPVVEQTAPSEPASAEASEPVAEVAAAEPPKTWDALLNDVAVDDLRRHPRVSGIVGQMLQQQQARWVEEQRAAATAQAKLDADLKLEQEALDDPDAFVSKYVKERRDGRENERIAGERNDHRVHTRNEFAHQIGSQIRTVPGFNLLTADDQQSIAQEVMRLPEDQAIGGLVNAVVVRIAERRAEAKAEERFQSYRDKELAKEREALRTEVTARELVGAEAPDISRTRGSGTISDEPDWLRDPRAWDAWYERKHNLRGR